MVRALFIPKLGESGQMLQESQFELPAFCLLANFSLKGKKN